MDYLYVILSHTNSNIGRAIRTFTRHSYNHASISLRPDLSEMYSFGRHRRSNFVAGGFVKENYTHLMLGRDTELPVKIFKMPVSEEQIGLVRKLIAEIDNDGDGYQYNLYVVLNELFHTDYSPYKTMTCLDFTENVLKLSGAISTELPCLTISHLEQYMQMFEEYAGDLRSYPHLNRSVVQSGDYYIKYNMFKEMSIAAGTLSTLFRRTRKSAEK